MRASREGKSPASKNRRIENKQVKSRYVRMLRPIAPSLPLPLGSSRQGSIRK